MKNWMKFTLRIFGILGITLFGRFKRNIQFGMGFGFAYGVHGFVEEIGKDFIKQRINFFITL